jgi:curved DNA-binding protein CbpA
MSDDNYYEELGVEPGASRDEIREAHRQRVADLEAAREKKGVNESQLQANRDQVARVRAAWNVLSDPFQRQRYDARLSADSEPGGDVELVDDDEPGAQAGTEPQVTGWRKLLAPPPPKPAASSGGNSNGTGKNAATNRRPRPEPTVALPAGTTIAEPRTRGMALLFDIAVLLIIFVGLQFLIPPLIQSDYRDIQDRVNSANDLKSAREDLNDAQKSVDDAKTASDKKSAQSDLKSAQKDYTSAQKDAKDNGVKQAQLDDTPKQLQTQIDKLGDKVRTTTVITLVITFLVAMLYLVPITVRKGSTFGMRNRGLRIVRIDGTPVGWYGAFTHFALPILLALAIPQWGPILGLGMVAWGYFDRNGQGIHDKLARTLVVSA